MSTSWKIYGAAICGTAIAAVGVAWLVMTADADRDGVSDRRDRCPKTPPGRVVDAEGCCAVARAVPRGIQALARESRMDIGEVWFLQKILRIHPDKRLRRRVERAVEQLVGDRAARLVNPEAERMRLPEDPDRGIRRLVNYVFAPVGAPEARAVQFVTDFLAREEDGYPLTHQLLALEWAADTGLDLPESLRRRRASILERMQREQVANQDQRFSDLYAERTALLLAYGSPALADAGRWIDRILEAQDAEGGWHDPKPSALVFDGEQASALHTRAHTTAFAVGALAFFLERY